MGETEEKKEVHKIDKVQAYTGVTGLKDSSAFLGF